MANLFNNSRFNFVGELVASKKGSIITSRLNEKSEYFKTRGNFGIKAEGSTQYLKLEYIHPQELKTVKIYCGGEGDNKLIEIPVADTLKAENIAKAMFQTTIDLETDFEKKKTRESLIYKRRNHENKEEKTQEDLDKIAEYTKQIDELSDNVIKFIHDKDVMHFLNRSFDSFKGKKVRVTGNVKSNYYNGKNQLQYVPNHIEFVPDDYQEGLTFNTDVFYDKDSIEDDKKEKKMFINGYIGERVKKADKLFPIGLVLDYSKINEEDEKQSMLLKLMKDTFEIKDKKQVHKIGVKVGVVNGSEKIEFDESCLTERQKTAVALGMNKVEDFRPRSGNVFGEYKQELKVLNPMLRDYPEGSIEVFSIEELEDYLTLDDSDVKASDVKVNEEKTEKEEETTLSTEDLMAKLFQ